MSRGLELQEKLRRSEVLSEEDIYKDFMSYAAEVSDELDVYDYMEENHIGTNITQYWLARFRAMRSRCQLVPLVQLVSSVKSLPDIEVWKIDELEHRLYLDFQKVIHGSFRGRRKVSSFSQLQKETLHPDKRKIGNIEVYIDEPCRRNYYLQDYAKFIEEEMKEYCTVEREDYRRKQARKPLSFLAQKQQHLLKLAEELLSKNNRKSLNQRNSIGPSRLSNQLGLRNTDKFKQVDYHTPKGNEEVGTNAKNISQKKSVVKVRNGEDRSRDSVQILKQMRQKQVLLPKSPKFKYQGTDLQLANFFDKSFPIQQRCRNAPSEDDQNFGFSFGKRSKQRSARRERQMRRDNRQNQEQDNAFIMYSFSLESVTLDKSTNQVKSEDFQLGLLLNQFQREKYDRIESQTISDIDSNQQNQQHFDQFNSQKVRYRDHKQFQILLETDSNHVQEISTIKLEQLVEFDEDEKNPELFQTVVKPQCSQSERKPRVSSFGGFWSEQKRLSNIIEENSFFSDSRQKQSKK